MGGGKGWVREHRPVITEGYGQSGLGLFIFLEKNLRGKSSNIHGLRLREFFDV